MKRLYVHTLLFAFFVCLSAAVSARASDGGERPRRQGAAALRDVRTIYVGDMGKADEAERFRFLLGQELEKKGFKVVERADDADAVLTGALSVRVGDDTTEARAFVKLESRAGERLWARDFGHRAVILNPFDRKEPTKRRAAEIADELRKAWDRSK
jgi:hypothetical protein